jgi:uncharacterized protein
MRIEDRFTVPLPVEDAWKVLLDLERIAPCMPGAQLKEVHGEEYHGVVKVKLGAITAQFKGVAQFVEVDDEAHRAVLRAEGREMRGQGNAAATVTATLEAGDAGTDVVIDTDLSITGKVAQFGRGVMGDVSSKLLGEFARCLEEDLLSGNEPPAEAEPPAEGADQAAPAPAEESASRPVLETAGSVPADRRIIDHPEPDHIDLLAVAGSPVAQRVLPAALVVVLILLARTNSRFKRWVLALVGGAAVAAQVAAHRDN